MIAFMLGCGGPSPAALGRKKVPLSTESCNEPLHRGDFSPVTQWRSANQEHCAAP